MASKLVAVVGESGSGKSSSIKHLDSKETYIINVSGKQLPFRGSEKLYNTKNKNYFESSGVNDIIAKLKAVSEKAPHIKQIIIDDANYLMSFNLINKAMETGFVKFSIMAKEVLTLVQECKKLRDDLIVYYFTHSEPVSDGDEIIGYKIKTFGKAIDSQIVMEGLFTIVLYSNVECKGDECKYQFITNRNGKVPAKSPSEMFKTLKIDNNLQIVTDTIRDYYN